MSFTIYDNFGRKRSQLSALVVGSEPTTKALSCDQNYSLLRMFKI